MGVSQDLRGLKVVKIPARYLSDSASDEEKQTAAVFKDMIRGLHSGEQSGVLIPSETDDQGNPLFDFDLKSIMGQTAHDVDAIIGRYRKEIITGILCPQLILGQDGSGSFALSESLGGVTDTVVGARLREIRDQLNHDLIPQLFALNGWDTSVTPYFDFEDFSEASLDDFSKAIQRIASVGCLVANAETVNYCHEKLGAPVPFDRTDIDIDEVRKFTTPDVSNSGEGMQTGSSNGTSNSAASRDNSSANLEN
jgi:phage gp29-like protein